MSATGAGSPTWVTAVTPPSAPTVSTAAAAAVLARAVRPAWRITESTGGSSTASVSSSSRARSSRLTQCTSTLITIPRRGTVRRVALRSPAATLSVRPDRDRLAGATSARASPTTRRAAGQPGGDGTRRHLLQHRDLDDGNARHVDQDDRAALGVGQPAERGERGAGAGLAALDQGAARRPADAGGDAAPAAHRGADRHPSHPPGGSADEPTSAHRRQAREYASRTTSWASAGLSVIA